jgi:hypothetical protein
MSTCFLSEEWGYGGAIAPHFVRPPLCSTPGRDCSKGWDLRHLLRSNPNRGCSEAGNKVWEPRGERTKWGAEGRWDSERTKWGAVAGGTIGGLSPPISFKKKGAERGGLRPHPFFFISLGGLPPPAVLVPRFAKKKKAFFLLRSPYSFFCFARRPVSPPPAKLLRRSGGQ